MLPTNHLGGGPPIVGCTQLLILCIPGKLRISSRLLRPQAEGLPSRGDRGPTYLCLMKNAAHLIRRVCILFIFQTTGENII
jgi:hypothetical protein